MTALLAMLIALVCGLNAQDKPRGTGMNDFSTLPSIDSSRVHFQAFEKKPLKFSAQAYYVLVPVIVTDSAGKHVAGLKTQDFQLFENGKPMTIASVDEITTTAKPVRTAKPATANQFSNETDADTSERRLSVIVLDMINTAFLDQAWARRATIKFLADGIADNVLYQLVILDSKGMHILHDFTSDPEVLVAALKKVNGRVESAAGVDRSAIVQGNASGNVGMIAHDSSGTVRAGIDGSPIDYETTMLEKFAAGESAYADFRQAAGITDTLGAFQQLAQRLSGVPGRKSLIWITGSFPFLLNSDNGAISEGIPFDAYQHTMQLLSAANISMYPVDARGLVVAGQVDATEHVTRKGLSDISGVMAAKSQEHADTIVTMRTFAEMTGGKAYVNTNDLPNALRDAAADGASYYMLTYAMDKSDTRQGWRKLKVKLDRDGYRVRQREGFYVSQAALDPNASARLDIDNAFRSPLDYTGLPVRVTLNPPPGGHAGKVNFSLLVPPKAATVDGTDNNHLSIEIWYMVRDEHGKDVGHQSKTYNLNLNAQLMSQLQGSGIGYDDSVQLAPGQYTLQVVVRDNLSGRIGSVNAPLKLE